MDVIEIILIFGHRDYPYLWSDRFCYDAPEYLANGCPNGYPYI